MPLINRCGGGAATLQEKTVAARTYDITVTPDSEYDGLSKVIISGYSVTNQSKTATPTAEDQNITPDTGYDGLSKVTVKGDSNLIPENIKKGVSIFDIEGTATGSTETKNVTGTDAEYITISGISSEPRIVVLEKSSGGYSDNGKTVEMMIITKTDSGWRVSHIEGDSQSYYYYDCEYWEVTTGANITITYNALGDTPVFYGIYLASIVY